MPYKNPLLAAALAMAAAGSVCAQSASAPPAPAPAVAPAPAPTVAAAGGDALQGKVAWYGAKFAGRKTASGQRFDPNALTMAHRTLPFGTRVKVTNTVNQRSVVVRVNDRGPTTPDRIGDVSAAAAARLRMQRAGVVEATLEVVGGK
jgi:rare lipoprotein A